jgi:ATP-dependent DNA helicase RecG
MAKEKSTSAGSSIQDRGTGVSKALSQLGLDRPEEALLCLPSDFVDCRAPQRKVQMIGDEQRRLYLFTYTGDIRCFVGNKLVFNLGTEPSGWRKGALLRKVNRIEVDVKDEIGRIITQSQFGSVWRFKDLNGGDPALVIGRIESYGRRLFISETENPPVRAIGRVWVRYSGIPGQVSGDTVEELVRSQIDNPQAWAVSEARLRGGLCMDELEALSHIGAEGEFDGLGHLLRCLHTPQEVAKAVRAREVATKLTALAIQNAALRHNTRAHHPDAPIPVTSSQVLRLAATQPETLSEEQRQVALDIASRLGQAKPLQGLLSGDVGTGKTLTFLLPAVAAVQAGARVAVIAPTDLLADQIAQQAQQRFGALVDVERVRTGRKIVNPAALLVGSPGITTVAVKQGYYPNLLICDEQHKQSTQTRERLVKPWTHVLEATATPIPRSLASALYGGMEIFNLRKCPVEKTIHCRIYDIEERPKASAMLRWALQNGHKAAVVYPRVESKSEDVQAVTKAALALEEAFPGKVAMLHGKMSEVELRGNMEAVRSGERPLIVASTVLETGIDIPSVAAMVVRDAENFGISQLHQLRGRLVRNGGEGWFAMLVNDKNSLAPETIHRLQWVATTQDGYELAELDLVNRGFGDVDGQAQSGRTRTLFRLVKLTAADFLAARLSDVAIEAADMSSERQEAMYEQPRLFG